MKEWLKNTVSKLERKGWVGVGLQSMRELSRKSTLACGLILIGQFLFIYSSTVGELKKFRLVFTMADLKRAAMNDKPNYSCACYERMYSHIKYYVSIFSFC